MAQDALTMLAVGDLIFEEMRADALLDLTSASLKSADLLLGQGEITYSTKPVSTVTDRIHSPRNPDAMRGLVSAGFDVISLAGNHVWDLGRPGIKDTIELAPEPRNCYHRGRYEY